MFRGVYVVQTLPTVSEETDDDDRVETLPSEYPVTSVSGPPNTTPHKGVGEDVVQ